MSRSYDRFPLSAIFRQERILTSSSSFSFHFVLVRLLLHLHAYIFCLVRVARQVEVPLFKLQVFIRFCEVIIVLCAKSPLIENF